MQGDLTVVIVPAMGTKAQFYRRLVAALDERGIRNHVHELAGHRGDGVEASWTNNGSYATMLDELRDDIAWLRQEQGAGHISILGHSLGGHLGSLLAGMHPDELQSLALVASCLPWLKAFEGKNRWGLAVLSAVLPVVTHTLGYFPGHSFGFAGREFRDVMSDWNQLVRHNRFPLPAFPTDIDDRIGRWQGEVLSLAYSCDRFAPETARRALSDRFDGERLSFETRDASGFRKSDSHFDWARYPDDFLQGYLPWLEKVAQTA